MPPEMNQNIDTGLGNFGQVEQDESANAELDDFDGAELEDVEDTTAAPDAAAAAATTPLVTTPPAQLPEAKIAELEGTVAHLNATLSHLMGGNGTAVAAKPDVPAATPAVPTPTSRYPQTWSPERVKDYEGVQDMLDHHSQPFRDEVAASHGSLVNAQDQMSYALTAIVEALSAKGIDVPALKELTAVEQLQQQIFKSRGVWMPRGEVAMFHRGAKAPAQTAQATRAAADKATRTAAKVAAHNAGHITDGGNAFALPRTQRTPQSRAERIRNYEETNRGRRL